MTSRCWPSPASEKKPSCSPRSRPNWPPTRPAGTPPAWAQIRGVTEEISTGVHRLYHQMHARRTQVPAINVKRLVTKSKFDNLYGCPSPLVDGIKRATDVMIAGKVAVVAGYGDVGSSSARAHAPYRPRCGSPKSTRSARSGRHGRLRVVTMEYTAVITRPGHEGSGDRSSDNEIDVALDREIRMGDQPQVDHVIFPDCQAGEPGLQDRPSQLCDVEFLCQPDDRPDRAVTRTSDYPVGVHATQNTLTKVARPQLRKLNVHLTELTDVQATYIGVPKQGPYKAEHYRY